MACGWIRGVINVLRPGKMLPQDHMAIVFKILKTATSADFVATMTTTQTLLSHGLLPANDLNVILAKADSEYLKYKLENKWAGELNKGSVFMGDIDTRKCYNCQKVGHISTDCPLPDKRNNPAASAGHVKSSPSSDLKRVPKRDEGLTLKFPDGRILDWCGRCVSWGDHHVAACTKTPVRRPPAAHPPPAIPGPSTAMLAEEPPAERDTPVVGLSELSFTGAGI
jgi:hypothetical protein